MRSVVLALCLVLFILALSGCGGGTGKAKVTGWNMPVPVETGVDPELGYYVRKVGGSTYAWFQVIQDETTKKKFIRYAEDGIRYDTFPIINGAFYNEWGEIGGTHCPTDGYAMSGCFTTPTHAEMTMKFAHGCSIVGEGFYTCDLSK